MSTTVCVPIARDGSVDPRWGRADRVAIAAVGASGIESWQEHEVGWGRAHDSGPEGQHHARIATFLRDNGVQVIVAGHMGPPMQQMLTRMGIPVHMGAAGSARDAVVRAVRQ